MAWSLAAIMILGLGVPIGAWGYTRLRPLPPVSRLGTGYGPIDRWLLHRHGLPPFDRERVRHAVFQGRQVSDPALAPAARELAAKVLAGDFGALRLSSVLMWFNMVMAVGLAVTGTVVLVASRHADARTLGALALFNTSMFIFAGVMVRRQAAKTRHAAATALQLNQTADNGAPH